MVREKKWLMMIAIPKIANASSSFSLTEVSQNSFMWVEVASFPASKQVNERFISIWEWMEKIRHMHVKLINLYCTRMWFDWLWPISDHRSAVICHSVPSMIQALVLPADRTGNLFESECLITHFIPIVLSLWPVSYLLSPYVHLHWFYL